MIPCIIDMETGDPDDFFNMVFLVCHPEIDIQCITIAPGSKSQIAFVKCFLSELVVECKKQEADLESGLDMNSIIERLSKIKVGAFNPHHKKDCLSGFLAKLYPNYVKFMEEEESIGDGLGYDLMSECWRVHGTKLLFVTGAPLSNLGTFIKNNQDEFNEEEKRIGLCVIQGGYAGPNVVPEPFRLKKFKNEEMVSTYNFGGNVPAAKMVLNSKWIDRRILVSKNVCHGVIYGPKRHTSLESQIEKYSNLKNKTPSQVLALIGLRIIYRGMAKYLEKNAEGKKFHDVLAGAVAIKTSICQFKRVEVIESKNKWGSKESLDSNTFISISANQDAFFSLLEMQDYFQNDENLSDTANLLNEEK
ncbi:predicted protein [Naegleria gruberi]|uniref:Predicted protein n=1 Tax=Naegleria gruberi TaxID=5762 RepID=D2VA15_NAEGR|nr:uncharacterized protein NAEGRDRAFT_47856 [Naegleria gruberi]EFC46350.1 predicted protein [Naegleria gruberi]|eukprot:XP_002679094.1 predicted protein [Naegleria gruberi strain NEG-M]